MTNNNQDGPLQKKCVVFLDILGFKELVISASKDCEKAQSLEDVLRKIEKIGSVKENLIDTADVTIFSDSVVISVDQNHDIFSELIERLATMMWTLMCDGVWMRGGVAIGLLSNSSHRPWGPAFIEAYETETRLAVHPRLVFSRKAFDWLSESIDVSDLPIKRDKTDGIYFIDVVGQGVDRLRDDPGASLHFAKIREHLNIGYSQATDNPSVFRKYSWLCREWDRTLGSKQANYSIDLEPFYSDARQDSAGDFDIATLPSI